jgi:hypothetical protein
MITPETRRQFIREVARAFYGTDFVEERDGDLIGLAWEKDGLTAGAAINEESAWVWLANATAPADSAEEAVGLLNAIFADEIVAVAAYDSAVCTAWALANAIDIHRPLHLLVPLDPRLINRVSELHVRSWSGTLDTIRHLPPERDQ